jgi:hypothetical protein
MKSCSNCHQQHDRNAKLCRTCHAAYMRNWRITHRLTPEQRKKDNCRSYASVYKRLGKLIPLPCQRCGSLESQMHHPDYGRPLVVEWLCRGCHLKLHREAA